MTEYASLEDLDTAAGDDPYHDLVLPSGLTVCVRGLSRYEWFLAGKNAPDGDANAFETQMIAMGMMTPAMTVKQAEAWRKRPGAMRDVDAASGLIRKLSGQGDEADKSGVRPVGEQS